MNRWIPAGAMLSAVAASTLVLTGSGCSITCTTEIGTAIVLTVVDSLTGGLPSAPEMHVIISEGNFRDSTTVRLPDNRIGLLGERPGLYRLEIRAEGYKPWVNNRVRVLADECHVRTVELRAPLQRL